MSHSHIDPDDPRLTAYALGELDDAAERQAVERLLADSPTVRTEVEQIRLLAQALTAEYDRERENYALEHPPESRPANLIPFPTAAQRRRARWSGALLKIAATLMVLASLAAWEIKRSSPRLTPAKVAVQTRSSVESAPSAAATPADSQLADMAVPPPTPQAETAEPLVALAKPKAREHFDKSAEDSAGSGDVLLPAAPASAPAAASPMVAMRAVPRRSVEASKSAVARASAAGASAKRKEDAAAQLPGQSSATNGSAPDERAAGALSAPSDGVTGNVSEDERHLSASLVSVQWQDGGTTAGVVIAPGGLILTPAPAVTGGVDALRVTLGDGSIFKVSSSHPVSDAGLFVLKIDASGLTAVSLAVISPPRDAPFVPATVNHQTGDVEMSRAKSTSPVSPASADHARALGAPSKSEIGPVDFVFDAHRRLVGFYLGSADPQKAQLTENSPGFHPLSVAELETLSRMIAAGQP